MMWLLGLRVQAVAVIADHSAYYVPASYQTGFGYKLMGWCARSDSTGRVYERTQTQSTQA